MFGGRRTQAGRLAVLAAVCLATCLSALGPLSGQALGSSNVGWGAGQEAQLPPDAATSGQSAAVNSISCPSPGGCTAVGWYSDSASAQQGLLMTQGGSSWDAGVKATPPPDASLSPGITLDSVSCASAGNCTAAGYYNGSTGLEGLLISETGGVWGAGVEAPLPNDAGGSPNTILTSVSCPSAGDCTAVGHYTDTSNTTQGLLLTEAGGTWTTAIRAPLPASASASPGVTLSSVACASPGSCTVVGSFTDSSGTVQGLLLTEASSSWSTGTQASLPANTNSRPVVSLSAVSCATAGNCTAVGNYLDGSGNVQGLLLTQSAGAWSPGVQAPLPANASQSPIVSLPAVSCSSAGDCTAVGVYSGGSNGPQGLLLTQTAGSWGTAVQAPLPGNASSSPNVSLPSVSCASAGSCSAVGQYMDSSGSFQGLLLTETSGTWAGGVEATQPSGAASSGYALLQSVSCATVESCSTGGYYEDSSDSFQGLLLDAAPTGTSLSLNAPSGATVGSPISSSSVPATLSDGTAPTGTITFTVFGPQASPPSSCTSGGTTIGTATISGNGSYYPGANFTPSTTGTYWWYASYSGDASDIPTASQCGANMASTTVTTAATSLTVSAPSTDTGGVGVHPDAQLSGSTAGSGGTVSFRVFGPQPTPPNSCTSGGTSVGTDASVSGNGSYNPGADFVPGTPGTYWWYATYSGDSNNAPSAGTCGAGMASTVVTNATTLSAGGPSADVVGTAVTPDTLTAALSGAAAGGGGTITFTVFGPQASAPSSCTSGGSTVGTSAVSGSGTYNPSAGFTPTAAGTYWWYASYSGDADNSPSSTACGAGMPSMSVSMISTLLSAGAPTSGTAESPIAANSVSATLSNAANGAGGTITFIVYGPQSSPPDSCAGGGTTVDTVPVSGNGIYNPSVAFTPTEGGTYWWYAQYSGDQATSAASSVTCPGGMPSTVVDKLSGALSAAAPGTTSAGSMIAASSIGAGLSGAANDAGGTITFTVFGPQSSAPSSCDTGGTTVGTAAVAGNGTYSPSAGFTPTTPGTYWWYASYDGDGADLAAASDCGSQMSSTVVSALTPTLSTAAPTTATVDSPIATSSIGAGLSGAASNAGGTITFTVFGPEPSAPSSCTTGGTTVGTAAVAGSGTYSPSAGFTPTTPGIYWWYASYGGDGADSAVSSDCGSQMSSTVVSALTPTLSAAAPGAASAGSTIAASSIGAGLSRAANNAGGTITFTVFGPQSSAPSSCATGGTTVGTAAVSGSGTYSPSAGFTPTAAGRYWWYASYGGDGADLAAASACGSQMSSTVVSALTPTLSAAAPSRAAAGSTIAASSIGAGLSGAANNAGGTITFIVFGPQPSAPSWCATGGKTLGTAAVAGDGTYHPGLGFAPASPGTYWWYASYSGDSADSAATALCGTPMASTVVAIPPPSMHNLKQSHTKWQLGTKLPTISAMKLSARRPDRHPVQKTPIGTTFTFTLNQPATVKLVFTHVVKRRTVTAGTVTLSGHAGNEIVAFQGRLSKTKKLAPGSYTVTLTAINSARETSPPQQLHFTVVS